MTQLLSLGFSRDRPLPKPLVERLQKTGGRMRAAQDFHQGNPYNLSCGPGISGTLQTYLINNLGDPFKVSPYVANVCDLEREAIT